MSLKIKSLQLHEPSERRGHEKPEGLPLVAEDQPKTGDPVRIDTDDQRSLALEWR
jgi:hypothetical protein